MDRTCATKGCQLIFLKIGLGNSELKGLLERRKSRHFLAYLINYFPPRFFPTKLNYLEFFWFTKKGVGEDPSNYLSVYLTSVFSKVIESVLKAQVLNCYETGGLFSPDQFGLK